VRLLLLEVSASMFGTSSSGEEHDLDRDGGVAFPNGKIEPIADMYKEHEKELEKFVEQAGQERGTGIRLVNLAAAAA
jgi:hypothetical protein